MDDADGIEDEFLPRSESARVGARPSIRADIRKADAKDVPDIVRVLRTSRLESLPYAPPLHSEAEDLDWVRDALIPSGGVTLALLDERIVGVMAVSRRESFSWIDQLYIEPRLYGRGIGTQLLQTALASLPRPIRLYTFQQNRSARRFYERLGFRPISFSNGSDNEERCPDVLYELDNEAARSQ
jgi:GNAT superfamily N-acetyltransferase